MKDNNREKKEAIASVTYTKFHIRDVNWEDSPSEEPIDSLMLGDIINAYETLSKELQNDYDIVKAAYFSYKKIRDYLKNNNPAITYDDGVSILVDAGAMIDILENTHLGDFEEKYYMLLDQKMVNEYAQKYINFLHTIKSTKYKGLDFNKNRLSCMDVNLKVIKKFKLCQNISDMDGFDEIKESALKYVDTQVNIVKDECLDLLGVYISPSNSDKGNILLSKEKIQRVSKKYDLVYECLYSFVKIHEYAHASMCPILSNNSLSYEYNAVYVLIEESLATAMALKKMKNISEYEILEKFVRSQPLQYRFGLYLMDKHEGCIEILMQIWKDIKSGIEPSCDDACSDELKILFYELTKDECFLPADIKEIFLF